MGNHTQKKCPKCNQVKPLTFEHWYPSKRTKSGFRSPCRSCHAAYRDATKAQKHAAHVRWYSQNRDKKLEYMKDYQATNSERLKGYLREYYLRNKRRLNAQNKEYYEQNKAAMYAACRKWVKENPEMDRAYKHNYRARKLGIQGFFTGDDLIAKLELQGNRCYYCGVTLNEYHIDHKIPLSAGGPNWPANICVTCEKCNSSKQDKSFWEFIQSLPS